MEYTNCCLLRAHLVFTYVCWDYSKRARMYMYEISRRGNNRICTIRTNIDIINRPLGLHVSIQNKRCENVVCFMDTWYLAMAVGTAVNGPDCTCTYIKSIHLQTLQTGVNTSIYVPRMRLQGHFILLCAVHTTRVSKYGEFGSGEPSMTDLCRLFISCTAKPLDYCAT